MRDENTEIEQYGFHLALVELLRAEVTSVSAARAHLIGVPIFLPAFLTAPKDVERSVAAVNGISALLYPFVQKGRLLFSLDDFSVRPLIPSELTEFILEEKCHLMFDRKLLFPWINTRDLVLSFQSNLENWHNDLIAFPLPHTFFVTPKKRHRRFLYSFMGRTTVDHWPIHMVRGLNMRQTWESLKRRSREDAFIGTATEYRDHFESKTNFYTLPQTSVFTLCPRGIANWTYRLFEAIRGGSIPVILSDSYIKPYSNIIPWDEFSIRIPEANLFNVDEMLRRIDKRTICSLQSGLVRNQQWFTMGSFLELLVTDIYRKMKYRS